MSPVVLLLIGVAIVVAGIVGLRVHPFLALVAAALTVAFLTPEESVFEVRLKSGKLDKEESAALMDLYAGEGSGDLAEFESKGVSPRGIETYLSARKASEQWFVSRVAAAFGEGCGKIAIIIAMASIIGVCLLDSGGARRVVDSLISLMGLKGTPFALALSAFTLGIPVFFDTVFYLMVPLARSLREKSGKDYLLYILAIVAGATMAHSLVPPTPGPLTVITFFQDDVSLGAMMIGGLTVGLVTVVVGVAYAFWANKRWEIPFRHTEESLEGQGSAETEEKSLPPLWMALMPIALPLILIGGQLGLSAAGVDLWWMRLLGDKNIALIIAALSGLFLLVQAKKGSLGKGDVSAAVQRALASGGVIILITSAGSAFGDILRETGISESISRMTPGSNAILLIPVAYLVTAMVRTAQGSATVAMITAGGMIAPIAHSIDLPFSPLYLALAIGCGSKPISWANDSGFWVIGRMSGMTPVETFKTVSIMMILMSLAGLAMVLLGALVLPLR